MEFKVGAVVPVYQGRVQVQGEDERGIIFSVITFFGGRLYRGGSWLEFGAVLTEPAEILEAYANIAQAKTRRAKRRS